MLAPDVIPLGIGIPAATLLFALSIILWIADRRATDRAAIDWAIANPEDFARARGVIVNGTLEIDFGPTWTYDDLRAYATAYRLATGVVPNHTDGTR